MSAFQFDWFTLFIDTEIDGVNVFVVCHQRLGNEHPPDSRTHSEGGC